MVKSGESYRILLLQENKFGKAIEETVRNEYVHITQRGLIKHMHCRRLILRSKQDRFVGAQEANILIGSDYIKLD